MGDIGTEMSRAPQRSRQAPVRRPTPSKRAPARGAPSRPGDGPGPGLKTWLLVGAGLLGVLVLWKVAGTVLGGGTPQQDTRPPLILTGPSGSLGTGDAPPAPAGSQAATFPTPVIGTRLELKAIALGAHPPGCVAQDLRSGGKTLTVFHHRCADEPDLDRYFFLVRLTNHSKGRVYVNLDGFTVEAANGKPRPAFATPPVGSPSTRFIADTRSVAADQSIKGWITIDGTDGFTPVTLVYADGAEILRVRFQGDWL